MTLLLKNRYEIVRGIEISFLKRLQNKTRARVWSRVPFVSPYLVLLRQSKAAHVGPSLSLCYSQVFSIRDRTFAVGSPFTQPVLLSLPLVLRSSDQDTGVTKK